MVECTTEFRMDFLQAQRMSKPPAIDGDLADWAGVPAASLEGPRDIVRSPEYYAGPSDLGAAVRLGWDENALYLAAEVTDDVFFQKETGFLTWKGDCLQLGIDLDPDRAGKSSGNLLADAGSRRQSEIDLTLTTNGPEICRTITFDHDKFPIELLTGKQGRLAVVERDGKLIYETAIAWKSLGATRPMKLYDRIGFALTVNDMDNDAPKQLDPKALGMFGGISGSKDPDKYGVLTLGDRSK